MTSLREEVRALRSEVERLRKYDAVRRLEIERLRAANRQLKKSERMLLTLMEDQ